MSEFWKKRRPRLSEDEERALWERVRTMPSEASGRGARARSPWAALWARPAVRFGAPVLAVALVAIVWVAQRPPEAPRPETMSGAQLPEAVREVAPMATTGPAEQAMPAPEPAPAPAVGREARLQAKAPSMASGEAMDAAPERERDNAAAGSAPRMAKDAPTFAAPPAAAPRAETPAPTKVSVVKGGAAAQEFRAMPTADSAADPLVAAIRGGDYASQLFEEVVRPSTPGAFGTTVDLPLSGTRRVTLERDERRRWSVVDNPVVHEGSLPRPGPLERRAALAVELLRAIEAGDASAVDRVHAAAVALQRELPADEGARALVAWATAARAAVQEP